MAVVNRDYPREFKVDAVERVLSGKSLREVARELKISHQNLSRWRAKYLAGGPGSLRRRGEYPRGVRRMASGAPPDGQRSPPSEMSTLVAELQRKIGQQQLDLDFFVKALRQVEDARQSNEGSGAPASTPSSRR